MLVTAMPHPVLPETENRIAYTALYWRLILVSQHYFTSLGSITVLRLITSCGVHDVWSSSLYTIYLETPDSAPSDLRMSSKVGGTGFVTHP